MPPVSGVLAVSARASDGKLYTLPGVNTLRPNLTSHRNLWINQQWLDNLGLETLAVRMERYCANALCAAQFLEKSDKIEYVTYPGLAGSRDSALVQKYLPRGCSGVISFSVKGGRAAAVRFMDSLTLASNVVHVADIRTCVLHPASSTHRQLTDEQLAAAGIDAGMIRLSVGLEHSDDIIADLTQALAHV